jgi:hypothetical protein
MEKRGGRACPAAKAVAALLSEAGLERWQVDDLPRTALDEDEVEDVVNLWGRNSISRLRRALLSKSG